MMARFQSFMRRNSTTIGVAIIIVAFMAILYLQSLAMSKLQSQVSGQQEIINQIKRIADQVNDSGNQRTEQTDNLNRHLDCIVIFFSQPDRSQKAIEDIETCQFKDINTGQRSNPKLSVITPVQPLAHVSVEQETPTSQNVETAQSEPSKEDSGTPSFLERLMAPINDLTKRLQRVQ